MRKQDEIDRLKRQIETMKGHLAESGWMDYRYGGWFHYETLDKYVQAETGRHQKTWDALIALAKHTGVYDNYLSREDKHFKYNQLIADLKILEQVNDATEAKKRLTPKKKGN